MKVSMPSFETAAVLVVGDAMLDRYWHGPTSRISPEAPVPVVNVKTIEDRPGGAGNVALNIAALGAHANLVCVTGEDEAATVLQQRLSGAGVNCCFHRIPGHPTITKLRVISRQQQLIRLDFEDRFSQLETQGLASLVESQLDGTSVMILSDYGKGSISDHQALIAQARAKGIKVLADPKGSDFSIYRGATLITPNYTEFEEVVGECATEADVVEKGLALLRDLQLEALLVTRGEKGMTLLRDGEPEFHLPARAREVFDVTGAGDTVISTLAAAIAAGEPLTHATALANIAAGIVVGKLGTATVSAPELRREVSRELGTERGVVTDQQLLVAIEDARSQGESIVMTNGCFDILHAGHVAYLEQAKQLGNRLIVAVNDDDSVKRLKGDGRPINPVDRRMLVLAGLGAVDWVVSFNEDTPEHLLEQIKPDVLVKGGDYRENEVVGAEIVKAYGGVVKVLKFVDSVSTTLIVEKIQSEREKKK